jgi:hypothetical protein
MSIINKGVFDADTMATRQTGNDWPLAESNVRITGTLTANAFAAAGFGVPTLSSATNINLSANGANGGAVVIQNSPLRLRSYTTADRGNITAAAGDLIFNSTTLTLQDYDGTSWANVDSGDVVLIKTASFSAVASTSTTFDGVFTSAFKSYRVVVRQFWGNSNPVLPVMNLRSGGTTNSGSNHNYYYTVVTGAGATSVVAANSSTNWLMPVPWIALGSSSSWYMDFTGVGDSYAEVLASFSGLGNGNNSWYTGGVRWEGSATTFDGFIITPTNGTISGTVDIYGYK